jgi:glutaredoxin
MFLDPAGSFRFDGKWIPVRRSRVRLKASTKKYLLIFGGIGVLWLSFTVLDKYSGREAKDSTKSLPKTKSGNETVFSSPRLRELNDLVQKPVPVRTLQVKGDKSYEDLQYDEFPESGQRSTSNIFGESKKAVFAIPTIKKAVASKKKPKKTKREPKKRALPKIEVFVANRCATCRRLEDFLHDQQVKFKLYSIDDARSLKLFHKYGYTKVPMVKIGRETIPGNDPQTLLNLLNQYKR